LTKKIKTLTNVSIQIEKSFKQAEQVKIVKLKKKTRKVPVPWKKLGKTTLHKTQQLSKIPNRLKQESFRNNLH
jgi:hypothetical protein